MSAVVLVDPRVGHRGIGGFGYCVDCGATGSGMCPPKRADHPRVWAREARRLAMRCACATHADGSVTTFLCPVHADADPCLTMSQVTGRRRTGTLRRGVCTACGHTSLRAGV